MMHALAEAAASNGHTYMSWQALHKQSLKLLRDSGTPDAINTRLHPFTRQSFCRHLYHCCCVSCHLLQDGSFAMSCNCTYLTLNNMCGLELSFVTRACLHSELAGTSCVLHSTNSAKTGMIRV